MENKPIFTARIVKLYYPLIKLYDSHAGSSIYTTAYIEFNLAFSALFTKSVSRNLKLNHDLMIYQEISRDVTSSHKIP